ncbi:unnamed protein product [Amoebophrya sp. A25]|nr:unnamed protein product [Amoebophrya sp. A25]|eukprot:GSA25T00011778001.1
MMTHGRHHGSVRPLFRPYLRRIFPWNPAEKMVGLRAAGLSHVALARRHFSIASSQHGGGAHHSLLCFVGAPASGKGSYTKLAVEVLQRILAKSEKGGSGSAKSGKSSHGHQNRTQLQDQGEATQAGRRRSVEDSQGLTRQGIQVQKVVASDLIKAEIKTHSAVGQKMAPFMEKHLHVPSELIVDCFLKYLEDVGVLDKIKDDVYSSAGGDGSSIISCGPSSPSSSALSRRSKLASDTDGAVRMKILLDGFPRSVEQAETFLRALRQRNLHYSANSGLLDLNCLHLKLKREWARSKAVGRLVCSNCDFPYNDAAVQISDTQVWETDFPEKPKCGGKAGCTYPYSLTRRDSAAVFDQRYDIYLEKEHPVVEFFAARKLSDEISNTNSGIIRSSRFRSLEMRGGYRTMADEVLAQVVDLLDVGHDVDLVQVQREAHNVLDEWEQGS